MFKIKICGVTRPEDAAAIGAAGADAIGLNFYAKSPRSIDAAQASRLATAAGEAVTVVGVFVNASAEEINAIAAEAPLDAIQLHGDEPDSFLAELVPELPVIRAVRLGADGLGPVADRLNAARTLGRPYSAVLIDAAAPKLKSGETVYGGSGLTADWDRVCAETPLLGGAPLILAGGLTPHNVGDAIRATGVDGVDTASGVETSPGIKDPLAVRGFVREALGVFGEIAG